MAGERRNFEPSSGWNEDLSDHQNLGQRLIDLANSKVSLDTLFNRYNIVLQPGGNSSGWAFRGSCPFPDHRDKRPSFGYNPHIGVFNCFGCHRSGKAVEFVSYMEGRSKVEAARELVGSYSTDEITLHNVGFDFKRLRNLLFDFADTIRLFNDQYGDTEYAKAVTWNLDVYLRKNVPLNTIVLDDLEARIIKLKSQLEAYGE